jgi:copper chaperone CopZ
MTISAVIAEQTITEHVRAALANVEGPASAELNIRNAEQELVGAQDGLEAAVRAFDGMGDELAVREKLAELRQARR